ncbi:MAG: DNA-processing protein DprA [Sphingobacteriaceae bacterium]
MSVFYQIALTLIPGVGCITARALLSHFGSSENVFKAPLKKLLQVPGIGPQIAANICSFHQFDKVENEIRFINEHAIKPLFLTDVDYPKRLAQCYDAPLMLYYRGNVALNQPKVISVVGTRKATTYGKMLCDELLEALKPHNPLILSGLAYGIDGMAHKACLKNNLSTIGVLAHGLDRIYPSSHRGLAGHMLENGGLLTEFISQTNPDRENFPKRNRIIAGMADATIVVEAHAKGGALITAELANNYNRDVFAFPGRVHDEQSCGCNYLIKTNRANLITQASDLAYLLGWERPSTAAEPQISMPIHLSKEEQIIYDLLLNHQQMAIDELMLQTQWAQSKLVTHILEMEMKGILISMPGKQYKLV